MNIGTGANGTFSVSYDSAQNEKNDPKDIVDGHLFRIETLADGARSTSLRWARTTLAFRR